jgi:hypothetical protein
MYEAPDGTFPPCPEIFGKLFYIHPGLDYLYPMTHNITVGSTVCRPNKGATNGRTGQVIEVLADHVRVHWTRKANGGPMSSKSWSFASDLKDLTANKAVASIQKKMLYLIQQVEQGPLVAEERQNLFDILAQVKGDNLWAIGIRSYMQGPRDHDDQFLAGLAEQCMDDIFTMTCIVGQKAVVYLLRTVIS